MKKITKYHVKVLKNSQKNEFKIEFFNVLLENDDYVVIDNFNFQSLRKSGRDTEIDTPIIYTANLGIRDYDGIYYSYYTFGTHKAVTIQKEIAEYIKKKYGYLTDINLDFIQ